MNQHARPKTILSGLTSILISKECSVSTSLKTRDKGQTHETCNVLCGTNCPQMGITPH
jgi:hypothetical protein